MALIRLYRLDLIVGIAFAALISLSLWYQLSQNPSSGSPSVVSEVTTGSASSSGEPVPDDTLSIAPQSLAPDIAESLMYTLLVDLSNRNFNSLSLIAASGDRSFVPPLIDLLHLGIFRPQVIDALSRLTGEEWITWKQWMEWSGKQSNISPPQGYSVWKGRLFSILDLGFADFLSEGAKYNIRPEEIVWGGVPVDDGSGVGIPALVNPEMITPYEATYLNGSDRVFGVSINGDHRAYPLRIMNWHELFNDVIGGKNVALAYCTLCGAGILYDTTVEDTTFIFRTSGLLYRSNKLMYDDKTKTLWNQMTGKPVVGELVDSGIQLKVLPVTLTTWDEWLESHPDTLALDINTGYIRNYAPEGTSGAAYIEYFGSPDTMFPVAQRSDKLETKELVFALNLNDVPKAYPLRILREEIISNDVLGELNLVLITDPASGAVRAYERGDRVFQSMSRDEGIKELLSQDGAKWEITEDALINKSQPSQRLSRLSGHMAFWFGWFAFYPETLVYGQDG